MSTKHCKNLLRIQFALEKSEKVTFKKVTFKKGLPLKSKNMTLDINTEMTDSEHNTIYKYLRINEANGINHTINKEKIRKEFYRKIRAILASWQSQLWHCRERISQILKDNTALPIALDLLSKPHNIQF